MDIKQLVELQRDFDTKHGWTPQAGDDAAVFRAIQGDLIGVLGEMGEFANIIKKLALEVGGGGKVDLPGLLAARRGDLAEELVDVFIYLIRIASHLGIDIEQSYLDKLKLNEQRFKRYEHPPG